MEIAVIAVIALIVLGPSRLPDAARSIGKGMREMRDSFQGLSGDDDDDDEPRARRGIEEEDLEDFDEDEDLDDEEELDHQNAARSSVPSASSSSTDRV